MAAEAYHSDYRVYYEDTDMAGIVYHANYLKFFERGRSDAVRSAGIDQGAMLADGMVFAVVHMDIAFRAPARFGDVLHIATTVPRITGAALHMHQTAHARQTLLAEAQIRIACVTATGKVLRVPAAIRAALQQAL
ncbi:MAG: YbgC/FadM family acyl-CoA thioesterase [Pseudomonadota bacterium]